MASNRQILFLFALVFSCATGKARFMVPSQNKEPTEEILVQVETEKSSQFCQLCEQFASEAWYYLAENETQTEIISTLHLACSKIDYFKQQCITLVDYYVPLLFKEVENISPQDFCEKVKLCKEDTTQIISILEGYNDKPIEKETMPVKSEKSSQWCQICEEFATEALSYIENNQTDTEIVGILHLACSKFQDFEEECIALADYYASLLFTEVEKISPEKFCEKINFCVSEKASMLSYLRKEINKINDNTCSVCEEVIQQILTKLKDPDTQFEIIEILLKGCNKAENFVQQCKRVVLQYGPLFLSNMEKFLETKDVCTVIHACKSSTQHIIASV